MEKSPIIRVIREISEPLDSAASTTPGPTKPPEKSFDEIFQNHPRKQFSAASLESAGSDIEIKTPKPATIKQPVRHYIYGTVESHRRQNRLKSPKKERPDFIIRPYAGYVWDSRNFQNPKWHESALLLIDGYNDKIWTENFPEFEIPEK